MASMVNQYDFSTGLRGTALHGKEALHIIQEDTTLSYLGSPCYVPTRPAPPPKFVDRTEKFQTQNVARTRITEGRPVMCDGVYLSAPIAPRRCCREADQNAPFPPAALCRASWMLMSDYAVAMQGGDEQRDACNHGRPRPARSPSVTTLQAPQPRT